MPNEPNATQQSGGPIKEGGLRMRKGQIDWIFGVSDPQQFKDCCFQFKVRAAMYLSSEVYTRKRKKDDKRGSMRCSEQPFSKDLAIYERSNRAEPLGEGVL